VPPSPARLAQDITEIMQNEQFESDKDNTANESQESSNRNSSSYDSQSSKNDNASKQNLQKQQKQFENSWESSDMSYLAETPV
jgi:transcriptional activator Myb